MLVKEDKLCYVCVRARACLQPAIFKSDHQLHVALLSGQTLSKPIVSLWDLQVFVPLCPNLRHSKFVPVDLPMQEPPDVNWWVANFKKGVLLCT